MNRDKDIEILSAYLDGELSPEEINQVEDKLGYTPELREKLAGLKKLRELTRFSIKRIPEAPYFETRFFAYLEDKPYRHKLRKWSPLIGFTALTLIVMLLLKFNPDFIENVFEEQKLNLAGFYKENLKPLLFAADLSNEDIFNFAFYNQLPLDNTKTQYIQLGQDKSGDEYFEINTAGLSSNGDNFKKFIETLSLNIEQKEQFDSIMSTYAEALQSQILVNDKNTVAISPNLWNYQKAIAADILAFAKASSKGVADAIPVLFKVKSPMVEQVVHKVKTKKDNEYIFFTPDTLFIDSFAFNKEDFKKEMQLAKDQMKKSVEEMKKHQKDMKELNLVKLELDNSIKKFKNSPRVDKNINIFVDSNICRVHIDKIEIPDIEFPDMDSLEAIINEATNQVKAFSFKFDIPKTEKNLHKFDFKIQVDDSIESFHLDIPVPNVDSILNENLNNLEGFNFNMPFTGDSMMNWLNLFRYEDSISSGNPGNFEFRMKEFEEQMEKFQEEMEKLKKQIQKDSVKVKTKKYIEI